MMMSLWCNMTIKLSQLDEATIVFHCTRFLLDNLNTIRVIRRDHFLPPFPHHPWQDNQQPTTTFFISLFFAYKLHVFYN